MISTRKLTHCFIIGPMKDISRLLSFCDQIIKLILKPPGFEVNTPDNGDTGNVVPQVLTASIVTKGRPFIFNFRSNGKEQKVITDIPANLSTLNESIMQRRRSQR